MTIIDDRLPLHNQTETEAVVTGRAAPDLEYLSGRTLGWAFVVCAGLLVIAIAYFVFVVLESLTQPTKVLDDLVTLLMTEAKTGNPERVETAVHLALILEYANADLRAAGVQVAFSLVAGMLFAIVGVLLFAAGTTGALDVSGEGGGNKFKLNTAAPGLVSLLLGGLIIGVGVYKDMSRSLQAEVLSAIRMDVQSSTIPPPPANGEGVAKDETLPH